MSPILFYCLLFYGLTAWNKDGWMDWLIDWLIEAIEACIRFLNVMWCDDEDKGEQMRGEGTEGGSLSFAIGRKKKSRRLCA